MQIPAETLPFQNSGKEVAKSGGKRIFGLRLIHSLNFSFSHSNTHHHPSLLHSTPVCSLSSLHVISISVLTWPLISHVQSES